MSHAENRRNSSTPVEKIIRKFGSVQSLADAIGVQQPAVSKWRQNPRTGEGDGVIPVHHHTAIIEAAKSRNIQISAEDFFSSGAFEGAGGAS